MAIPPQLLIAGAQMAQEKQEEDAKAEEAAKQAEAAKKAQKRAEIDSALNQYSGLATALRPQPEPQFTPLSSVFRARG